MFAFIQTAETIEALSKLMENFQGWGGIGAVLVAMAAMPAVAVIGLAVINQRAQGRLIDVIEKNTNAALKTAEAVASLASGVDEVKETHRELAAKTNGISKDVGLILEHARAVKHSPGGGN